ncbi:hypothetical protein JW868_02655 [Candidatus Woesearchaeota archaeon]|nr:hypothetical protein [Candidatus Woesearchaeota archaeon]
MKCDICGQKVEQTFLKKLVGTYVKDKKGKRHPVCMNCQSSMSMEDIKKKL